MKKKLILLGVFVGSIYVLFMAIFYFSFESIQETPAYHHALKEIRSSTLIANRIGAINSIDKWDSEGSVEIENNSTDGKAYFVIPIQGEKDSIHVSISLFENEHGNWIVENMKVLD
ncbi:cytochrome c oxidase assembly factor Coa1 family protein [Flammeovirga kamogawensis]|uniref:DUF4878 domain-containing protein n=1 Tax=Flammeovirga kamogawensis TaxID=373891 RepID=A0ABX8GSE9_9BACT|nr:cytochrome c oxidase assembly factor Coa1 family protein [Flammeovirga kamogawensis]MBB6462151.1 hypothetical protein [Flammeovirga kamogawensis]QWG05885.1 hypothetical protein KM029_10920 [Flammeovirga kamogawensis]TRX67709.1 hypothetical protein EO216_05930 [Flammeovirga kamogawensis]